MLKSFLTGAFCLLWVGFAIAQQKHYFSHENKLNLTPTNNHFIIIADDPTVLADVRKDQVKEYQSWPHARHAILSTPHAMNIEEVVANLGFDTDEVQVSPAYTLADGFKLYPTPTVVFKPGDENDLTRIESVLADFPIKTKTLRFGTWRVELKDLDQVFAAAEALWLSGLVAFAHPDFYAPMRRHQDPLYPQQFQLHNYGQNIDGNTGMIDADCNAHEAWAVSRGSGAITVAVLDDGLEEHEDLRNAEGQSRFIAGYTPVNGANEGINRDAAHGMACAGIIAASHNDIGIRGVAPYVRLLSVNIFAGGETTQDVADGISWAKNQGADVLSNSWGYSSCELAFDNIADALTDANSTGRGGLGSIIVFSSGNDYYNCVSFPGNHPDVISVGAYSSLGERSGYANYGPELDLVAGSDNVRAPGAAIRTIDRMGPSGYSTGNYTADFGGTSAAAPVVAGTAALILGYNPTLSSDNLKNILYASAKDMGPSGFDPEYGHGGVDAYAALIMAGSGGPPHICSDGFQNGLETGTDCGGRECTPCITGPITCTDFEAELQLNFDNFPAETSWTLTDEMGRELYSSPDYSNELPRTTVTQSLCLPAGCYTFSIRDLYGDGFCCDFGSGGYTLTADSTLLASGGDFERREDTDFCLGYTQETDTEPPGNILELITENPTHYGIDLRWAAATDNVGVTGYVLFLDGEVTDTVTATAFRYESLTYCTTYTFGLAAFDAAGNMSDTVTVRETTTGCLTIVEDDVLNAAYFEQGWDGWTDGGGDCYRYRGEYSFEGDFSIRLRDDSGESSAMTSPPLDLNGRPEVNLNFYFLAKSMETEESFLVNFYDGSKWQTVARYVSGVDFQNDLFYRVSLTLSAERYGFHDLNRFQIQCDANSNADQVYIDQVTIAAPDKDVNTDFETGVKRQLPIIVGGRITPTRSATLNRQEGEVILFPNPASRLVNIVADEPIEALTLFAADGRRVKHLAIGQTARASLSVAGLPPGVYLLSVLTAEEVLVERLIVR